MTGKRQPKPLTLDQRIEYQTTNCIDLDTGYLGATPDNPGGCMTLGRIFMKDAVLISRELLDDLVAMAKSKEAMAAENVALLAGLKGKHALTGATYDHLVEQIEALRSQVVLSCARVMRLELTIKPVLRHALDHAAEGVHVCDREDDEVLAASLLEPYRKLYEAMKHD